MSSTVRFLLILATISLLTLSATFATNSDFKTIYRTVTLDGNGVDEVTLTIGAYSDMLLHQVSIDNRPTGLSNLCTPDWNAVPATCTSGDSGIAITAFRVGDSFLRTGDAPYKLGSSDNLVIWQLFSRNPLDDVSSIPLPRLKTFSITLRAETQSNNVKAQVVFGVTGGAGLWLRVTRGPVNP